MSSPYYNILLIYYGSCFEKRQSPICTVYSVTLVLACSVAPVGRLLDAKHWHCVYSSLFRLATGGMGSPHLGREAGRGKTSWMPRGHAMKALLYNKTRSERLKKAAI